MSSSFFPSPDQEPTPQPVAPAQPPWLNPPEDEYPVRVLVREFLAQTDGTALTVSHVDVYSTGVSIRIEWVVRRRNETVAEWQTATGAHYFAFGVEDSGSERRFGLALGDGTVVTTVDRLRGRARFDEEPAGWSLMDQGGGGTGGERQFSSSCRLWLWPLPPPGPIELVGEWGARGIAESRLVLDGTALLSTVDGVRSFWPSDGAADPA